MTASEAVSFIQIECEQEGVPCNDQPARVADDQAILLQRTDEIKDDISNPELENSTKTTSNEDGEYVMSSDASILSSVLNLMLTIIGAGTLALPYAVAQVGYLVSGILFILVAVLNILTLNLNMECAKDIIPFSSFYALCNETLPKFKYFVDITVICATFGILCVDLVVIGDLLPDIVATIFGPNNEISSVWLNRRVWISIYLVLFIMPTVSLKKMDSLRFTSFLGIICYFYIITIVVIYAMNDELNPCRDDDPDCMGKIELLPSNYLKIFKVIPFFVQIYICHFNTFSICNELRSPTTKRMNTVAILAILGSMLIYAVVGYGAYMTFGDSIDSNIILKYPQNNMLLILRISLSIAIVFGYPVTIQSPRNCLSTLFFRANIQTLTNMKYYGLTYLIVLVSFGVAMVTDSITAIFGFVGSTATITVVFILPGLFYYYFPFQKQKVNVFKKYFSLFSIIMGVILVPFCIVMQYIALD